MLRRIYIDNCWRTLRFAAERSIRWYRLMLVNAGMVIHECKLFVGMSSFDSSGKTYWWAGGDDVAPGSKRDRYGEPLD